MASEPRPDLPDLRRQALDAARELSSDESALAGVLRDLEQERSRAAQAYHAVLRSLAAALEARDGYTGEHSDDVHDLSFAVARRLGLDERASAEVRAVALLHDVGKIGVPDQVLHKPEPLSDDEWALMREHPVIGERILRPLPGLSAVATAVRHEHERWDGTGYPDGLSGEQIPLASRIVLACDAWHALVSDRPYRAAMHHEHARGELRRHAGTQFDPTVVDALLACLDAPGGVRAWRGDGGDVAHALTASGDAGSGQRLERELHALIAVASAVGAAHRPEEVVELAADEACEAIDAASVSVSRWEVERRILRTMVNAGDLGPGEERLPADEVYRLTDDDEPLRRLIEAGETYVMSLDDEEIHPLERRLLEDFGKHHCIGVGILLAGRSWGELWATRRADQPRFDARDARFLRTIAGQIAAAVGRAEVLGRMAELAFEDPLTGVANRRGLDERLDLALGEALARESDLAVLLCDVDELKELNDSQGHQAGDEALRRVARTLAEEAGDAPGVLVARIGGDEFAVVLEGRDADFARALGERVLERLDTGIGERLAVSCGVASVGLGARRAGDLLRAADAAQYTAKRAGRARVCVADTGLETTWRATSGERRALRGRRPDIELDVGSLIAEVLDGLDGVCARRSVGERLEVIALAIADASDASAVAVSRRAPGSDIVATWFASDRRTMRTNGRRFGANMDSFELAEYPATTALLSDGGSFIVHTADETGDPAERALLVDYGMTGVVAVGVPGPDGGQWLVEIYADALTRPLEGIEPALRLLAREAVHGARPSAGTAAARPEPAAPAVAAAPHLAA